jgi:hypothetical protein
LIQALFRNILQIIPARKAVPKFPFAKSPIIERFAKEQGLPLISFGRLEHPSPRDFMGMPKIMPADSAGVKDLPKSLTCRTPESTTMMLTDLIGKLVVVLAEHDDLELEYDTCLDHGIDNIFSNIYEAIEKKTQ